MAVLNFNSSSTEGYPAIRFKSPSLPPVATAPSPSSLHSKDSNRSLGLQESTSSMTMVNNRRSISPPIVDRPEDHTVRDSPVSARSLSTPPLPQIPGSPTSMKPLPSHPPNAVHNQPIPQKNPERYAERYSAGRMSNMTFRTNDRPLASDKRRSNATTANNRRADSMAPSYTSTITPGKRAKTPGPFDRISTEPNFAQRVFDAGKTDLLYEIDESTRWPWKFEDVKHGVLDLTTLMRMQQHVLQQKLVAQVNALGQKGAWMEIGVGETMKEYCQLTRDMDFITTTSASAATPSTNPFLISTMDPLEAQLLEEGGLIARRTPTATSPTTETSPDLEKQQHQHPYPPSLPYTPQTPAPWRQLLRHYLSIFAAAFALIVPFLIMMLVPSLASRVATTCAMVAFFALVVAASGVDTRRAVAYVLGYAGALVVFGGLVPPVYWS